MTCQHCQTWVLDDDHRCRRCGRRVRSTPSRISPNTYPIAATATAPAYDLDINDEPVTAREQAPVTGTDPRTEQQPLFSSPVIAPRVISFDSLTTPAEKEAIRARAADLSRPAPLKTAKVELRHARPRRSRSADQRRLDFLGEEEVLVQPQSNIICDAPVAPPSLRMQAAFIDAAWMAAGCVFGIVLFLWEGGQLSFDKHVLPFFALAIITIPFFYKLLWAFAGRDTAGMRSAGLRLVDFDGNPPSQSRRYQRLFGSILSLLAAGIGLVWSLFDEDNLTWHDHISGTFPTIAAEEYPLEEYS